MKANAKLLYDVLNFHCHEDTVLSGFEAVWWGACSQETIISWI